MLTLFQGQSVPPEALRDVSDLNSVCVPCLCFLPNSPLFLGSVWTCSPTTLPPPPEHESRSASSTSGRWHSGALVVGLVKVLLAVHGFLVFVERPQTNCAANPPRQAHGALDSSGGLVRCWNLPPTGLRR